MAVAVAEVANMRMGQDKSRIKRDFHEISFN
jgi:hypothetical protein